MTAIADLYEVVAAVLDLDVAEIDDDTGPATQGCWTSRKHIELIVAVEDTFGESFSSAEIRCFTTVGAIADVLRGRGVR